MPEHPTISLCMIVRNEAEGLARCLASAAAGVDEIIIVDTGSTDGTKAIAAGFTPHVYTEPWLDDFAGARNRAAERASGEWIMTLDGDDELVGAAQLRGLAAGAGPAVGAIMLRYITGIDAAGNVTQELWRERLTRRGAYTWRGRVHEALVPTGPLMPTGTLQRIQSTAAHVVHHGKHVRSEGSLVRNVRILERELAAMGELPDPRTLFYLARDLMLLGDTSRALSLFGRYLEIGTWDEELYAAWLFCGRMRLARGEERLATAAALHAGAIVPSRGEWCFLLAELAYYAGAWYDVIAWCDLGRGKPAPGAVLFLDPLALSYAWIIFYVNALWNTGQLDAAYAWTMRALQIAPDDAQHRANRELLESYGLRRPLS